MEEQFLENAPLHFFLPKTQRVDGMEKSKRRMLTVQAIDETGHARMFQAVSSSEDLSVRMGELSDEFQVKVGARSTERKQGIGAQTLVNAGKNILVLETNSRIVAETKQDGNVVLDVHFSGQCED